MPRALALAVTVALTLALVPSALAAIRSDPADDADLGFLGLACTDPAGELLEYGAERDGADVVLHLAMAGATPSMVCAGVALDSTPRWTARYLFLDHDEGTLGLATNWDAGEAARTCVTYFPGTAWDRRVETCVEGAPTAATTARFPVAGSGLGADGTSVAWDLASRSFEVVAWTLSVQEWGFGTMLVEDEGEPHTFVV